MATLRATCWMRYWRKPARFTETVLAPLNSVGDEIGCSLDKATGEVTTPPGFQQAYTQFIEGGWTGLTAAPEYGGQGLPHAMGVPLKEMIDAANLAWGNFPLLSHGAIEALKQHGEDVAAGSLPQAAGRGPLDRHHVPHRTALRHRPGPAQDPRRSRMPTAAIPITGTKIFITAGEHDLTENIVHLVLAKLPDAPPGAKGISLFIVPKFKVARDGGMGERNALRCGVDRAQDGHQGVGDLRDEFRRRRRATWSAAAQGPAGDVHHDEYRAPRRGHAGPRPVRARLPECAALFARSPADAFAVSGPKFPDKPADPIIVHPDVRRMLLTAEIAGRRRPPAGAACRHPASTSRTMRRTPAEREQADAWSASSRRSSKACQTEWGIECTYNALQCFGGHGYIREHGMEQLARDARITTLYEGTTGIQALDLMGRKTAATRAPA